MLYWDWISLQFRSQQFRSQMTHYYARNCMPKDGLTRALERGGGRFCPPLMFFVNIFRSIRSIAVIFQFLPKNKRHTFWCKNWRLVDLGGLFLSPQSQHFRFRCHDGAVLPPPPHRLAGPGRSLGGRPDAGGGGRPGARGAGRALGGEAAPGQGHG